MKMKVYRGSPGFTFGPVAFLIVANIMLFIVVNFRPELIYQLGLTPAAFLDRPWTIVTNLFIHAGFAHIFTNMLTLYFFGSYLNGLVGERNFFVVYFLGGVVGNIFYLLLGSPFTVVVGASGAVFALGGVLTVLRPNLRVFIFPIPAPVPLWAAVIGGFLIVSFVPFVAWQAHLGGLLFGLVMASLLRRGRYFR